MQARFGSLENNNFFSKRRQVRLISRIRKPACRFLCRLLILAMVLFAKWSPREACLGRHPKSGGLPMCQPERKECWIGTPLAPSNSPLQIKKPGARCPGFFLLTFNLLTQDYLKSILQNTPKMVTSPLSISPSGEVDSLLS